MPGFTAGGAASPAAQASTAQASPLSSPGVDTWTPAEAIRRANQLRAWFNHPAPTLTEEPALSAALAEHATYERLNNVMAHYEDPNLPGYSSAGNEAAQNSVLYMGASAPVDGWVGTPLHGEQVLNPRLTKTGFVGGAYSGMDTLHHYRDGAALTSVWTWPNGLDAPVRAWSGGEIPDPLVACPQDYRDHPDEVGHPLFVWMPDGSTAASQAPTAVDLTVASGPQTGTHVPVCVLRQGDVLGSFPYLATAILMPRHPFTPGTHYTARYVAAGVTATWDFTASRRIVSLQFAGNDYPRFPDASGRLRQPIHLDVEDEDIPPSLDVTAAWAPTRAGLDSPDPSWVTSTTIRDGDFTVPPPVGGDGWVRVSYAGDALRAPVSFDQQVIALQAHVSISAPTTGTYGQALSVRGHVECLNAEEFECDYTGMPLSLTHDGVPVATLTLSGSPDFTFVRPYEPGTWQVVYTGGPGCLTLPSNELTTTSTINAAGVVMTIQPLSTPTYGLRFAMRVSARTRAGAPVPGAHIRLTSAIPGKAGQLVGTGVTDRSGQFTFVRTADRTRTYTATFAGVAGQYGPAKAALTTGAAIRVTSTMTRASGGWYTWKINTYPKARVAVTAQFRFRDSRAPWQNSSTARTDSSGRLIWRLHPGAGEQWRVRASGTGHATSGVGPTHSF